MVERDNEGPRPAERTVFAGPVAVQPVGVLLIDTVVTRQVGRGRRVVEAAAGVEDRRVVAVGDQQRVPDAEWWLKAVSNGSRAGMLRGHSVFL